MTWASLTTEQRAVEVKDLVEVQGRTYSQAAKKLGTTPGAIAGVVDRNGIKSSSGANGQPRKHAGFNKFVALSIPPDVVDSTPLKPGAWDALPGSSPVPLADRTGCAWPLGDGHPFLFCNLPTDPGRHWCQAHFVMGNRPVVVGTKKRVAPKPLKGLTS